jgi:hypothetical protein
MKRTIMATLVACAALPGCALLSSSTVGGEAVMHSPPPPERKEEASPRLGAEQAWVRGYYEPLAGSWIWHPGLAVDAKPGYRVVQALYSESHGEFRVSPPHWAPARVANRE